MIRLFDSVNLPWRGNLKSPKCFQKRYYNFWALNGPELSKVVQSGLLRFILASLHKIRLENLAFQHHRHRSGTLHLDS